MTAKTDLVNVAEHALNEMTALINDAPPYPSGEHPLSSVVDELTRALEQASAPRDATLIGALHTQAQMQLSFWAMHHGADSTPTSEVRQLAAIGTNIVNLTIEAIDK